MLTGNRTDGRNTKPSLQALSELVEWYLRDKGVELRIVPAKIVKAANVTPEFDFLYYLDGRRITETALSMMMMIEFGRRAYDYNIPRIRSALIEHAWRYYIANVEYPAWLQPENLTDGFKKPVGRPRKHPPALRFDASADVLPQKDGDAEDAHLQPAASE